MWIYNELIGYILFTAIAIAEIYQKIYIPDIVVVTPVNKNISGIKFSYLENWIKHAIFFFQSLTIWKQVQAKEHSYVLWTDIIVLRSIMLTQYGIKTLNKYAIKKQK